MMPDEIPQELDAPASDRPSASVEAVDAHGGRLRMGHRIRVLDQPWMHLIRPYLLKEGVRDCGPDRRRLIGATGTIRRIAIWHGIVDNITVELDNPARYGIGATGNPINPIHLPPDSVERITPLRASRSGCLDEPATDEVAQRSDAGASGPVTERVRQALAAIYSGAGPVEAECLLDQLEDRGLTVVVASHVR